MIYPEDFDPEMRPICDALNALKGVSTRFSCIGHKGHDGYVNFSCTDTGTLQKLASWTCAPMPCGILEIGYCEKYEFRYTFRWPFGQSGYVLDHILGRLPTWEQIQSAGAPQ